MFRDIPPTARAATGAMLGSRAGGRIASPLPTAVLFAALCVLGGLTPREARAATARLQYLSGSNVYLDAGRAEGLTEGAIVKVIHGGREVARLTVVFVAEHSASCKIDSSLEPLKVGDACLYTPAARADSGAIGKGMVPFGPPAPNTKPPAPPKIAGASGQGGSLVRDIRGLIMSSYTRTTTTGGVFENPTAMVDLTMSGRAQEELSFRTFATHPMSEAITDLPGVTLHEEDTRIYEAALRYRNPTGRLNAAGGRILIPRLESIGYIDGGGASWRLSPRFTFGAAAGAASDLAVTGFKSQGFRLGGFFEGVGTSKTSPRRWYALLAAGLLEDSSLTRRQYLVQRFNFWPRPTTSFFQGVEVDYNPSWKQDLGEAPVALTAWSLGTQLQFFQRVWTTVGVDSRRPVLLPEQRAALSPPPLDRYTGINASARLEITDNNSLRVGGSKRRRDRDGKSYVSWDAGLNSRRLGSRFLSGGVHALGYTDGGAQTINSDANLTAQIGPWSTLELSGGFGNTIGDQGPAPPPAYRSQWLRASMNVRGPSGSWVRIGHEWQNGGDGNDLSAELGFTF